MASIVSFSPSLGYVSFADISCSGKTVEQEGRYRRNRPIDRKRAKRARGVGGRTKPSSGRLSIDLRMILTEFVPP